MYLEASTACTVGIEFRRFRFRRGSTDRGSGYITAGLFSGPFLVQLEPGQIDQWQHHCLEAVELSYIGRFESVAASKGGYKIYLLILSFGGMEVCLIFCGVVYGY